MDWSDRFAIVGIFLSAGALIYLVFTPAGGAIPTHPQPDYTVTIKKDANGRD